MSTSARLSLVVDPAYEGHAQPIQYSPDKFKEQLASLVKARDYPSAIALLDATFVDDQIAFEDRMDQYFAVGGNSIQVPGADREYDHTKDWLIPGTGEVLESVYWLVRSARFAEKYNKRLTALKKRLESP